MLALAAARKAAFVRAEVSTARWLAMTASVDQRIRSIHFTTGENVNLIGAHVGRKLQSHRDPCSTSEATFRRETQGQGRATTALPLAWVKNCTGVRRVILRIHASDG